MPVDTLAFAQHAAGLIAAASNCRNPDPDKAKAALVDAGRRIEVLCSEIDKLRAKT